MLHGHFLELGINPTWGILSFHSDQYMLSEELPKGQEMKLMVKEKKREIVIAGLGA